MVDGEGVMNESDLGQFVMDNVLAVHSIRFAIWGSSQGANVFGNDTFLGQSAFEMILPSWIQYK